MIGISRDSVASHDKFKKKYELPFTLASDTEGKVRENYGVWVEKSMYGRKYMGIERATFLIDEKGVVRNVWHKVKVPGHVDEVLAALEGAVTATLAGRRRARCSRGRARRQGRADRVASPRHWRDGGSLPVGDAQPPDRPARPARPELQPPRDMPRRRAARLARRARRRCSTRSRISS